jgi:hypothetical protein
MSQGRVGKVKNAATWAADNPRSFRTTVTV